MFRNFLLCLLIIFTACQNRTSQNPLPAANRDSLKTRAHFLSEQLQKITTLSKRDSMYTVAMDLKNTCRQIEYDTLWANQCMNIYNAFDEENDTSYNKYLEAIITEEHIAKKDILFDMLYVKALCFIASEREADYKTYASLLEKAVLHQQGLKTLGIGYEVWVIHNLGEAYTRLNDNNAGVKYLRMFYDRSSLLPDEESRDDSKMEACISLANTYRSMGYFDSALKYVLQAENFKNPTSQNKALTKALLAEVYHDMGNAPLAMANGSKAILLMNKLEEDGEIVEKKGILFSILADAYALNNQWDLCIKNCNQAIDKFDSVPGKISREKGKVFITKAKALSALQLYDSAFICINRSLQTVINFNPVNLYDIPSKELVNAENTIYEALDLKAALLIEFGNLKKDSFYLKKAIEAYTVSFAVEEKLMALFLYTSTTLNQLQESRLRSQSAINICYQLYELTKNNQWAEKAFEFAEKNKAFVLLESVKRNLAANSVLQNDTLYQKTQSLQLQLAYAERSIAEETNDSVKIKMTAEKNTLENDLLFAKTALARQSNAYKAVMEKEDSISAVLVSSNLLDKHTGLVEFFSADSVTYAFVCSKDLPVRFIKYNAMISAEIDTVLAFFKTASSITNDPAGYQKAAYQLYHTLRFEQINNAWQNLIIIPDGKLCFLPFDALVTAPANNINLQQASYFINQYNTVYGYSAGILLKQKNDKPAGNNDVTAFAPVFVNGENRQQPLLNTQPEAEAVAKNNTAQLFLKEKATLNNFKEQFTQAGILHIATHAYADTGIAGNSKIEFIDSSLLLNELYTLHTNASLVVLSACETAIGRLNSSEGSMSLARGFYYAGAKNVITSYWNVDDKSTASLFTSFYKEINSVSYPDALFKAKKEFIKNATATTASPYYWAGFVHIGMPEKKQGGNYWWWLLAIPAAGIAYYLVRRK